MESTHDIDTSEEKTRKRRRQTQHDTIKYLNDYRPQFLLGLTQTFKRMRHDDPRTTVAQYYRARGLFPLEATTSQICIPTCYGQTPIYTTYNPKRKTKPVTPATNRSIGTESLVVPQTSPKEHHALDLPRKHLLRT
ncbi:hypothetical protein PROFUN_05644 [Planoprotostelium fungivorum]|uniref:Uncharacterized protein n=1 Tax=Planoprotostelium fungivorum TaxID=1890364 RepID=A0A2P6MUG2_9EUKA|nr:hypothetical protein PROFUN_05644 [Planoprotostelium fungivorum]